MAGTLYFCMPDLHPGRYWKPACSRPGVPSLLGGSCSGDVFNRPSDFKPTEEKCGRKDIEPVERGRMVQGSFGIGLSFCLRHASAQAGVSDCHLCALNSSFWDHEETEVVDSGCERPRYCIVKLSYFLCLAGRSTAEGDIRFLGQGESIRGR